MIMNIKQRKIKIEPKTKLNYNIYSAISNYTKSIHHKITITEKKCEVYKKYNQDVF